MKTKESKLLRVIGLMLAFVVIAAVVGSTIPVLAADEGIISGQVVNKTAGGSLVGGVEVTLTAQTSGNATNDQRKVPADASGKFEFRGLPIDPGTTYTVGTTFQDADYTSETVNMTSASPSKLVELNVYDSTTSDENIQVSNGHIVVFADQGALQVLEAWRFSNVGTRTFIGVKGKAGRSTLQFTLPQGATSVSPGTGPTIEPTAVGAVYTAAVPPGVTDINFTYFIPYQGSSATISRKTDYPIADFRLLVEDTGVKVTSLALTPAAAQPINGSNYLDFTAVNVARGVDLDASFSGIVNTSAGSQASLPWVWLLAGGVLLGLMGMIVYPRLKKRQVTASSLAVQATPLRATPAPGEENKLLRELARLDDAYEAGKIDEQAYRASRAQAKASLTEMYANKRGN